jgi:predicted MPP superfamily phosphohydrolase
LSQNTAFDVSWTYTQSAGPITARTITVDVTSDDNTATLYLVYGGHVLATGTGDGTLSTTVDLDTAANNNPAINSDAESSLGLYHSHGAAVFWVVSDKGGSITLSGHANQGQVTN